MVFLIDPGQLLGVECKRYDQPSCQSKALCSPNYIPMYGIDPAQG